MLEPLTRREHEILQLLAAGMTNQEIADQLILSPGTVKAHTTHIFSKLGVANRTQALRRAQELQLLETARHAPPTQPRPRHNLPADITPFIGREKELATLATLMPDPRVRLITILGAGGMGKTRFALEAARRHLNDFPDGTFFVPLAQVSDARNIPATIIDAIGLPFHQTSDRDLETLLRDTLETQKLLLILDNIEHLHDSVDFLLQLLSGTSHLKILVTSRERLNISAEVLFVLNGMDYEPAPQAEGDVTQSDAAQLLVHLARSVNPNLELDDEAWIHITRICRLTQGMPLAIILAIGWLEMLSLAEIADEIADSINILQSEMHDLPERQRSMRATIAFSWNRLTPEEQRAFIQLSVFRGGFTREAARQVAGAGLHSLQTLVNRSFIAVKDGYYEIHELLRQFGWEYLQRETHASEICTTHSEYYLTWLHDLKTDIEGRKQTETVRAISRSLEDIRLAWQWALTTDQTRLIELALDTLYNFFLITGRLAEGIDLLDEAYRHYRTTESPLVNRLRVRHYSLLLIYQDQRVTLAEIEHCVALAEQYQDEYELAIALELLGSYLSYVLHDYNTAITMQERALALLQKQNSWFHMASVYHKLGYDHLQITGMEALIDFTERAYQIAKQNNNLFNLRAALGNLGSAACYMGRYDEAEQYYRDALSDIGDALQLVSRSQIIYFAHVLFLQGKFDEGQRMLQIAWDDIRGAIDVNGVAFGYALNGWLAAIEGRYAEALAYTSESLRETRNDITGSLVANLSAGMAYCGLGDVNSAEYHLREAFQRSQQMNFYASSTWGLPILVIARTRQKQFESAVAYSTLLRTHPLSAVAWLDHWALLVEAETELRERLDKMTYQNAQQYGRTLNLEAVVAEFLGAESSISTTK